MFGMLVVPSVARADHTEAVRLFEEGRKQREAGELEKALRTFERSLAEEKSIGAYFNLGLVLEQLGRYRDAYDTFQIGKELASSKSDDREKDLREAQSKLLDTRNHIQLAVPGDVKSADGVRIIVDNIEVPSKQYDGYVFRNQTQHEVVVFARGRKELRIQAKNRQLVAVSLGEPDRGGGGGGGGPIVGPDKTTPETSGGGWPTQKWMGLAMMGAGVGVGALGIVFNIGYLKDRSELEKEYQTKCAGDETAREPILQCGSREFTGRPYLENDPAVDVRARAESNDTKASILLPISYVSAAALFGFGLYFFVTADDTKKVDTNAAGVRLAPHVGPRDASLSVVGRF